jgi:hypothetical protein
MYAKKLLERVGMEYCNLCIVPMESHLKLSTTKNGKVVDATFFRIIVGSLRYLVHTRPDIVFVVSYVSRFMEARTTEHLALVKHLLCYIEGTPNLGIQFEKGQGNVKQLGYWPYRDANMAGDVDDRQSTTGLFFFHGRSPISWHTQKRRVVALSSSNRSTSRPPLLPIRLHGLAGFLLDD